MHIKDLSLRWCQLVTHGWWLLSNDPQYNKMRSNMCIGRPVIDVLVSVLNSAWSLLEVYYSIRIDRIICNRACHGAVFYLTLVAGKKRHRSAMYWLLNLAHISISLPLLHCRSVRACRECSAVTKGCRRQAEDRVKWRRLGMSVSGGGLLSWWWWSYYGWSALNAWKGIE